MNFFDKFKKDNEKKKPNRPNPLKNVKNPFAPKFGGEGQSLGGSHPGRLIHMSLEQPGTLGVKVSESAGKSVSFDQHCRSLYCR